MNEKQAKALREPFPEELVGKLPKPTKRDNPKGRCKECGGWHGLPAVHLDYVGHAAVTDRLLSVDPDWSWQPLAHDPATGSPTLVPNPGGLGDEPLGLWGNITVCGVTKPAFGGGKNAKECISDLIRNGAMRFGVGLDLWSKEDLQTDAAVPAEKTAGEEKGVPQLPGLDAVAAEGPAAVAPAGASQAPSPVASPDAKAAWIKLWDEHTLAVLKKAIEKMSADECREGLVMEGSRQMRGKGEPRKTVLTALSDRIRAEEPESLEGEPTATPETSEVAQETETGSGEPPTVDPASPSSNLLLVKAAVGWISDQPESVEFPQYWTVTNILAGLVQSGAGAFGTLEEVPDEWLQRVYEAIPEQVRTSVEMLGPEQTAALAGQAK